MSKEALDYTQVKERLREIISEVSEVDEIPDGASFKDLGIDSMMAMEIVSEVEREYSMSIPEEELQELTDLEKVFEKVRASLSAAA